MTSVMLRIVKQLLNDKRSLAIILIAPLFLLFLMYLLLGDSTYQPKIGVTSALPQPFLTALEDQNAQITVLDANADYSSLLKNKTVDAVLTADQSGMHIQMLEADSVKAVKITDAIKAAGVKISPSSGMELTFLYGKNAGSTFDSLGYMLLGVLSFFFVFIISGISFVRERTTGTMERLMLTPVKRYQVVGGYTVGFGIFAVLQSILVVLFTKYVLGMEFAGSVAVTMLIMILLSFTAVSMGALVSIFANSEFQVMQFIPIIIIPQIFFSGLIPVDTLPFGLNNVAYIMPVYYGCSALEGVLIRGYGMGDIVFQLMMLLVFIAVLFWANTLALKKYRVL